MSLDDQVVANERAIGPLLVLSLSMAVVFTFQGSFSTVQEGAKDEMHLSDYSLSLVQGLSIAIPLLILSIPVGALVDRINRVRLMLLLTLLGTFGTLLTAWASTLPVLFVGRMFVGASTTGALTAVLSLAADYYPPAQRGRAVLIVSLGQKVGVAAAFALAGWLLGYFATHSSTASADETPAWRSVHYLLAGIGAALVVPLALLREPKRREVGTGASAPVKGAIFELWRRRSFLAPLFIGQLGVFMADTAAAIWAVPVLSRVHGLHPQDFAGWMGVLITCAGFAGVIFGGLLADFGQRRKQRGGLLIGAIAASALGVPAALFALSSSVWMFGLALGVLLFCGTVTGMIVTVALTTQLPNELRGISIGVFFAVAGLIGYGIAPTLVTLVSILLGGEQHLAIALSIVGLIVSLISLAAFCVAMRRAPFGPFANRN